MWKHEKFRHLRAPSDKVLVLVNGERIETLDELGEAINKIDPETFEPHVNKTKNDFADWVEEAFGLMDLGKNLRKFPGPLQMLVHIEAFLRLKEYPVPQK